MSERWTRCAIFTPPTVEPVTVEELRSQVRITATDEDAVLYTYIQTARLHIENITNLKLVTQTWDVYYTGLDDPILLPFAPLGSAGITSVKYQDTANIQQTVSASLYESGERNGRPIVRLKYLQTWPSSLGHADDVVIRAPFGYGVDGTSVPNPLKQAILLLAAHWNEHREPVDGNVITPLPFTIHALLAPYTILEF